MVSLVDRPKPTPCSNTGSLSHRMDVSIDALTFLWGETSFDVLDLLVNLIDLRFDFTQNTPRKIGVFWDYCYRSVGGSMYAYRHTADGLSYRLAISGTDCAGTSQVLLQHLMRLLRANVPGVRCSRLDIALDDFDKTLCPELIIAAVEAGDFSGFERCDYVRNVGRAGWTVYLGSRQSEHFVRYYNKDAESRGRVKSYRYESEFKGGRADALFGVLSNLSTVEASYAALRNMVLGKICFYSDRKKNICRSTVADWWADFVARVTTSVVVVPAPRRETSIARKIVWIQRHVARSVALIRRATGIDEFADFVDELITIGNAKLRRLDELMLIEYETENTTG